MTEPANEAAKTAQDPKGEPREAVSVGQLNELTAKRQRMLLAGIATVILAGTSWVIFGTDHSKKVHAEGEPETIETASLVNRNLSQRELATVFGNRIDNVTRDQKALKDSSVSRPEMEAELAALKAENQAMRTDGQAAIDAISAENSQLKNQLQAQAAAPAPNAAAMPAYRARHLDRRRALASLPALHGRDQPARQDGARPRDHACGGAVGCCGGARDPDRLRRDERRRTPGPHLPSDDKGRRT